MDLSFSIVFNAAISMLGGAVATVVAYRPRSLQPVPKDRRLISVLRWLGPLLLAFGAWQLAQDVIGQETDTEECGSHKRTTPLGDGDAGSVFHQPQQARTTTCES